MIKFWDVDSIKEETVDVRSKAKKGNKTKFLKSSDRGDFFADLAVDENNASTSSVGADDSDNSDDDEDSDDDDSDDGDE